MANSEEMQTAVIQEEIQAATIMVRAMRVVDPQAEPYNRGSIQEEHCRPRQNWTNDASASVQLEGTW